MPNPQKIDRALIEHLGELARMHVPADRLDAIAQQLQQVVDAFSSLADADLTGPADATDATSSQLTPDDLRDDVPEQTPSTERILANAPQTATDCFVVPRVVEP